MILFVGDYTLHNDLHFKTIDEEAKSYYNGFFFKLAVHHNPIIKKIIHINPSRKSLS